MRRRTALCLLALVTSGRALAMYDPKPSNALALAPGAWKGSLTYRDWSNPEKLVNLPCRLAVALTGPDELALYFVFDDGPGKVVYSYDRMSFDFGAASMVWVSGTSRPSTSQYRLASVRSSDEQAQLVFERNVEARVDRYTFELSRRTWSLGKTEVATSGVETFRNKYELVRSEA
jgi:hypothetical protein